MGAFADRTAFYAAMAAPYETRAKRIVSVAQGNTLYSMIAAWENQLGDEDGATAPSTAAAPTNATTGAFKHRNAGGGSELWGTEVEACYSFLTPVANDAMGGMLLLVDRLAHQGGLDATNTSPQSTNLPTAALTRYTDGVGVMAALEVYTQVGNTATTWTISYTNTASTSGRTGRGGLTRMRLGGANADGEGVFLPAALEAGDTGVKSVESVTLASSTTSAGNFGVTLFKPLMAIPVRAFQTQYANGLFSLGGQIPRVLDDACLQWILISDFTSNQWVDLTVKFGQA